MLVRSGYAGSALMKRKASRGYLILFLIYVMKAGLTTSLVHLRSMQHSHPLRRRPLVPRLLLSTTNAVRTMSLSNEEKLMQDMLYRIRQVNSVPADIRSSLLDFRVNGVKLGQVRPNIAKLLCSISASPVPRKDNKDTVGDHAAFCIQWDDSSKAFLTLSPMCGTTFESRSAAVAAVTERLKDQKIITGWRNELFPVAPTFYDDPVFAMERAAVSYLGVIEYGVHVIGLVQSSSDNSYQMWMARRAQTKSKFPGMMDHIAAGGQPIGLSLTENVVKECYEEAGIPEAIARQGLRPAGAVTYEHYVSSKDVVVCKRTMKFTQTIYSIHLLTCASQERCVLFCFDLYLPDDFQPKPVDGEVEQFYLYSMEEVLNSMAIDCPDPIKPNCYTVIIDFLLRHGYISPEVPGYLEVLRELRGGVCQ